MTKNGALRTLKQIISYDKEIDTWRGFGFWQTTVNIGGDIVTYRIYDSGDITER